MNKQDKANGGRGIEWTDHTWNPVAGCQHNCRWTMPNGEVAVCYAETTAEGVAGSAYPQGFAYHYWKPERLDEPLKLKTPGKIFVGSMADVFGSWVPDEQINAVLDMCQRAHWHIFQFLTKNAPRLLKFDFPANCWVGISSPPDFMFGKQLSAGQQDRMLRRSLSVLAELNRRGILTWMSFEPLSWDVSGIVPNHPGALDWAVIGAASNGPTFYPPKRDHFLALRDLLDERGVPMYFKSNLHSLPAAEADWREDFPTFVAPRAEPEVNVQMGLWD